MGHNDTLNADSANRRYVKAAMRVPLLEADHELDLARRWREAGDEKALHELTSAYLRLVISMAGKFRNYGLPIGDLVQEGNIGLMQAAARFEPERELRFSTYASWWIRAAIQDYVLRNWSIVRTGTTSAQKSLFFNLRRLRALTGDPDAKSLSQPQVENIAAQLRVRKQDVETMQARLSGSDRSLNAMIATDGQDSAEWQDLLPDDGPLPDQIVMDLRDGVTRSAWLKKAMSVLTDRERLIIYERKLVESPVTLEALGKRLGVSKERVRQIENSALKKIKSALIQEAGPGILTGLTSP